MNASSRTNLPGKKVPKIEQGIDFESSHGSLQRTIYASLVKNLMTGPGEYRALALPMLKAEAGYLVESGIKPRVVEEMLRESMIRADFQDQDRESWLNSINFGGEIAPEDVAFAQAINEASSFIADALYGASDLPEEERVAYKNMLVDTFATLVVADRDYFRKRAKNVKALAFISPVVWQQFVTWRWNNSTLLKNYMKRNTKEFDVMNYRYSGRDIILAINAAAGRVDYMLRKSLLFWKEIYKDLYLQYGKRISDLSIGDIKDGIVEVVIREILGEINEDEDVGALNKMLAAKIEKDLFTLTQTSFSDTELTYSLIEEREIGPALEVLGITVDDIVEALRLSRENKAGPIDNRVIALANKIKEGFRRYLGFQVDN